MGLCAAPRPRATPCAGPRPYDLITPLRCSPPSLTTASRDGPASRNASGGKRSTVWPYPESGRRSFAFKARVAQAPSHNNRRTSALKPPPSGRHRVEALLRCSGQSCLPPQDARALLQVSGPRP
ncbi:unnamed protein product [Urochloa humidicola]